MNGLGASFHEGGATFQVWAPRCRSVELIVDGRRPERLAPREEGLFELALDHLGEGTRYHYRLDGERHRPDPASRFQPHGVHGPSALVDPRAFAWTDDRFEGHALADLVVYELHVGTFTTTGTFEAVVAVCQRSSISESPPSS